jgi:hypothetical protein
MVKFKFKRDHGAIGIIILCVIVLILENIFNINYDIFTRIVPGTTRRSEVILIMGEPDSIEQANNLGERDNVEYDVLGYIQRFEGWFSIRIWIDGSKDIVSAVTAIPEYKSKDPRTQLSYWVNSLNAPEEIYWTFGAFYRHLAWPKQGISIITLIANPKLERRISELIIYVPYETTEYLTTAQNLPYLNNISAENRFVRGKSDNIDTAPLDPFDWTLIKNAIP